MRWSVLSINYIESPREAISTDIQITSVFVDYLKCLPSSDKLIKCPISVMYRDSLQVQIFFPPELETMALCFGAIATQKPDFCALKEMKSILISPIGLEVNSPYFQSLFMKSSHP